MNHCLFRLLRQWHTLKIIADGQDSCKLPRQFQTIQISADRYRVSRLLQIVAHHCRYLHTIADSCTPSQTCLFLYINVKVINSNVMAMYGVRKKKCKKSRNKFNFTITLFTETIEPSKKGKDSILWCNSQIRLY